jgi:alkylation response protein AidB-like acyl-CoA dehydrogenase
VLRSIVQKNKNEISCALAKGEVGAFCLSEPEAGSDATSKKTTAIDKGDHYLTSTKTDYK